MSMEILKEKKFISQNMLKNALYVVKYSKLIIALDTVICAIAKLQV